MLIDDCISWGSGLLCSADKNNKAPVSINPRRKDVKNILEISPHARQPQIPLSGKFVHLILNLNRTFLTPIFWLTKDHLKNHEREKMKIKNTTNPIGGELGIATS